MSIGLNSVIERCSRVLMQEVEGAIVLVNLDTGNYYGLELTARRIWQLLDAPRSIAKICAMLELEFQVSVAQCETDVLEFAEQLLHAGAIELSAESSNSKCLGA